MRIAIVTGRFPAVSETFVSRQVVQLAELGHEVHVYANRRGKGAVPLQPGDPLAPFVARLRVRPRRSVGGLMRAAAVLKRPGVAIRLLNPLRFGADAWSLRLLFSAAAYEGRGGKKYDAVIAHHGPNGAVVAKLRDAGVLHLGTPVVTFFHGSDAASARGGAGGEFAHLFRTGERFIAVSRHLAARLVELGAPADRVHVVYNGVDLSRFAAAEGGPARDSEGGVVRLISVARLVPVKGLEHAIDAVAMLPESVRGRVRYEIVGEGPLRKALAERIERAGLSGVVTLRGALDPGGVCAALQRSHVFLFPSLNEGLGVAAIEAMACGLPVIGSRAGGIPEVVEDGVTGVLVPPGSVAELAAAIGAMVADRGRREGMGGAGRARAAAMFDGADQVRRVLGVVALARGGGGAG